MRKPAPSDDYTKYDRETGEQLHDENGREIPDPTPMQPPVGYNPQPTMAKLMREMIISDRLAREAREVGAETFEEADDFDIGDDFEAERNSPYEANFDPMTPEERAALASQGRDTERSLTAAEKAQAEASASPKQNARSRAATSGAPVSDSEESDPSDVGQSRSV